MRSFAEFTYIRAVPIVVVAAALFAAAAPFAAGVFDVVEPFDISDPDSEVQRAYADYERATGQRPEPEVTLLVESARGPAARERAAADAATLLAAVPGVAMAEDAPAGRPLLSDDREAVLVLGTIEAGANRVEVGEQVEDAFDARSGITAGGTAVAASQIGAQTEEDTRKIELYAAPVLLLLLLLVFRSLLAAALPLVLSAFSIVVSFALLRVLTEVVAIDLFSLQVVTGLGVGLAIDYSLLVLARYRTEIRRGGSFEAAQAKTIATAGRTIGFGALTVTAALAALILFPQQFLSSTGIAGALVALLSGVAALSILPAVLALLGPRIDPGFESSGPDHPPAPDPLSGPSRFWTRVARRTMAWPIPFATLALLLMLAIASPTLSGDLTTPDARVLPAEQSAKRVSDAATNRFSGLPLTRISVLAPPGAGGRELESVAADLSDRDPDVDAVTPLATLPDGSHYLRVLSSVDPLSEEGQDLLDRVRAAPWPEDRLTAGRAAELADQTSSIGARAGPVIAVVVLTNLLLMLLTVRSLVLPIVSILLNALTVGASYGIMVALFTSETAADLLGTQQQPGIDVSVPILAFVVVFGLSTDYGIFVFSRIREAREDGRDEADAIAEGIGRTGRLITSAAGIFSVAVGAFVFSDLVIVREFAVAVAVAVLLDATVIRGVLVPAILKLLGARAWWWPAGSRGRGLAEVPD